MGRAVCKDEQVSNWEAAELSTSQLHYAALDAHCLLGLLDNTVQRLQSLYVRGATSTADDGSVWPDVGVRGMYTYTVLESVLTDDVSESKEEAPSSSDEALNAEVSGSVTSGADESYQPKLHAHALTEPFRIALFIKNIPNM